MLTHPQLIAAGYQYQRGNPSQVKQALSRAGYDTSHITWYGHTDGQIVAWAVKPGADRAIRTGDASGVVACAVDNGSFVNIHYDRGLPSPFSNG
jgi:hypothetical protein